MSPTLTILSFCLIATVIAVVLLFRKFSGEDERIRHFLRVYMAAKKRFPDDDRHSHEAIADEHIHPTQAKKIHNLIGGARYLDGVFGNQPITVNELIAHFIQLEFPLKYPKHIDLEMMIQQTQQGIKSPRELLQEKIARLNSS